MTDTKPEWATVGVQRIHATLVNQPCGWHVVLYQTGPTMQDMLKPKIIAKSCVPYKAGRPDPTLLDQAEALAVGMTNIAAGAAEDCHYL